MSSWDGMDDDDLVPDSVHVPVRDPKNDLVRPGDERGGVSAGTDAIRTSSHHDHPDIIAMPTTPTPEQVVRALARLRRGMGNRSTQPTR